MTYEDKINAWRKNRERSLVDGIKIGDILWSPLMPEDRANFKSLNYFPIDPKHRFKAKVHLLEKPKEERFEKQDGTLSQPFLRTGFVEFEYENKKYQLLFIYDEQMANYYVPFRDLTSGKETYPLGRLLALENIDKEIVELDFNLAFNFACAYNETIACPLTPKENWLPFPIYAGEKKFR